RLRPAAADVHRRPVRPELPPHPGARVGLWLLVGLGLDRRDDDRAARVLPLEALGLRWWAAVAFAQWVRHAPPPPRCEPNEERRTRGTRGCAESVTRTLRPSCLD